MIQPPRLVAIQCVRADPEAGSGYGANVLLHAEDLVARESGSSAMLELLYRPRTLSRHAGHMAPFIADKSNGPTVRMFDPSLASKGLHMEMDEDETETLAAALRRWREPGPELITTVLAPGETLIFSNEHFVHGRTACSGSGRESLIWLGS
jgi:hypothetical protein